MSPFSIVSLSDTNLNCRSACEQFCQFPVMILFNIRLVRFPNFVSVLTMFSSNRLSWNCTANTLNVFFAFISSSVSLSSLNFNLESASAWGIFFPDIYWISKSYCMSRIAHLEMRLDVCLGIGLLGSNRLCKG